jgi:hypothetical protein
MFGDQRQISHALFQYAIALAIYNQQQETAQDHPCP